MDYGQCTIASTRGAPEWWIKPAKLTCSSGKVFVLFLSGSQDSRPSCSTTSDLLAAPCIANTVCKPNREQVTFPDKLSIKLDTKLIISASFSIAQLFFKFENLHFTGKMLYYLKPAAAEMVTHFKSEKRRLFFNVFIYFAVWVKAGKQLCIYGSAAMCFVC